MNLFRLAALGVILVYLWLTPLRFTRRIDRVYDFPPMPTKREIIISEGIKFIFFLSLFLYLLNDVI